MNGGSLAAVLVLVQDWQHEMAVRRSMIIR